MKSDYLYISGLVFLFVLNLFLVRDISSNKRAIKESSYYLQNQRALFHNVITQGLLSQSEKNFTNLVDNIEFEGDSIRNSVPNDNTLILFLSTSVCAPCSERLLNALQNKNLGILPPHFIVLCEYNNPRERKILENEYKSVGAIAFIKDLQINKGLRSDKPVLFLMTKDRGPLLILTYDDILENYLPDYLSLVTQFSKD